MFKMAKSAAEKLFSNQFVRNVIMIGGATAAGQVVSIALIPFIARIYLPEGMGLLASFMATVSILGVLGTLSYEQAIIVSEKEEDTHDIIALCITIILCAIIFLGVSFMFIPYLPVSERYLQLLPYFWLIVAGVGGVALNKTLLTFQISQQEFKNISLVRFLQSAGQNTSQIILGLSGFIPGGLLVGYLLGQAGGVSILRKGVRFSLIRDGFKRVLKTARRYIRYPKFTGIATILNAMNLHAPVLFIGYYYGLDYAGYYLLISKIFAIPVNLLARSSSSVLLGKVSAELKQKNGRFKAFFSKYCYTQFLLSAVIVPIISVIIYSVFPPLFGEQWLSGRPLIIPIAFIFLTKIPASSLDNVVSSLRFQNRFLMQEIFKVLLYTISFLVILIYGVSSDVGIYAICISGMLGYLASLLIVVKSVQQYQFNDIPAYEEAKTE